MISNVRGLIRSSSSSPSPGSPVARLTASRRSSRSRSTAFARALVAGGRASGCSMRNDGATRCGPSDETAAATAASGPTTMAVSVSNSATSRASSRSGAAVSASSKSCSQTFPSSSTLIASSVSRRWAIPALCSRPSSVHNESTTLGRSRSSAINGRVGTSRVTTKADPPTVVPIATSAGTRTACRSARVSTSASCSMRCLRVAYPAPTSGARNRRPR